jgi:hypothetical protein
MVNKTIQPILENLEFKSTDSFHIPLFATTNKREAFPAISFSLNADYNTPVLVNNTEDVGLTGGELVRESFKNLATIPMTWRKQILNKRLFLAAESPWASEKILDKAFLMEAAAILQSEQILVSIPKRGMILATSDTEMKDIMTFGTYTSECYDDMSNVPLSEKLFMVEQGRIKGVVAFNPPPKPTSKSTKNTVVIRVKNDISTRMVKKVDEDGFESYTVTLGTQDFKDFTNAAYQIILSILTKNEDNPRFTGLIEFNILSEWLPKSPDFDAILTTFLERLKRQSNLTDAACILQRDIAITFVHLSDVEQNQAHLKRRLKIAYQ